MNKSIKDNKTAYNSPIELVPVLAGILLNYLGSFIVSALGLPLYIDNVGTIVASILGGYLPGIMTAVINNIINYILFDRSSIYYASVSALIAVVTVYMHRRGRLKSPGFLLLYIVALALLGGVYGGVITLQLYGPSTDGTAYLLLEWCRTNLHTGLRISHIISAFILDFIDKAVSVIAALLIVRLIPESIKPRLWMSGWKQTPLNEEELRSEAWKFKGNSLNFRIGLILVVASLAIALVVTGVSSSLFRTYSKEQHMKTADGVAKIAGSFIDPDMVDEFIKNGEAAEGYSETKALLAAIRDSSQDIEYVYVYKIEEDGCHVVFDLDTEDLEGEDPGTLIPFDESFAPYIPALLRGEHIDPVETNDTYGWLLTAYEPVYNSEGECVCYACADVKVDDITAYEKDFVVKVILLFVGFFILILVTVIWITRYRLILPVNSMAKAAGEFAFSDDIDDEAEMEENLSRILDLKISTDDEIEHLYDAFCRMTKDTIRHMNNIKEQNDSILMLQNGLIMSMADMVEGRDSDTGNHVRKTAAYCRIIMEGLRRKGYYSDQLTDKFIYDVERSAPLHDIGKIAISDVILNKPGKLTDEEFEIMKTHTTEGKKLLDRVIESVEGESYLEEGRNLAAYHHEKWNGKGYPEGLSGEDIPLSARIMAIADVFDAVSSRRIYKPPIPFEKAVSIIQEDAGTHFDPKCVEAFMDSIDEVKSVLDYYNELEQEGESVRGNEVNENGGES